MHISDRPPTLECSTGPLGRYPGWSCAPLSFSFVPAGESITRILLVLVPTLVAIHFSVNGAECWYKESLHHHWLYHNSYTTPAKPRQTFPKKQYLVVRRRDYALVYVGLGSKPEVAVCKGQQRVDTRYLMDSNVLVQVQIVSHYAAEGVSRSMRTHSAPVKPT